jgi:hypothetical protein
MAVTVTVLVWAPEASLTITDPGLIACPRSLKDGGVGGGLRGKRLTNAVLARS